MKKHQSRLVISKNFKIVLILFILYCFTSCVHFSYLLATQNKYDVTSEYIKSNKPFSRGFVFSELVVDSVDSSGDPVKYEKIKSARLFIDESKKKLSKKIYFYKPNANYWWKYNQEWRLPVLPIKMQKNRWYMIEGLLFSGNPTLGKFIYIDNSNNIRTVDIRSGPN